MTEDRLAAIAKALGHPARLEILAAFAEREPRTVSDVVDDSSLAQSTISEHLRILRDAGVLYVRREGPRSWCCVRWPVLHQFAEAVAAMEPVVESR